MIRYLRDNGTQRMVGEVLRENHAMRELARAHGLHADPAASDTDAVRYVLALQADEPLLTAAA
jgi:acetyltransferase